MRTKNNTTIEEIDEVEESEVINYLEVKNGVCITTVSVNNWIHSIEKLFNRKEYDVYNMKDPSLGDVVNGVWVGQKRLSYNFTKMAKFKEQFGK